MNYIKDGVYPISEQQIRANHPNVCFPRQMEPQHAVEFGYELVHESAPTYNPATEMVTEDAPVFDGGQWNQRWTVSQKSPKVPGSVSARQARLALEDAGLLDTIDAAFTGKAKKSRIEWEYATEIRRDSPLVASMAAELGLTAEQLDQLFIAAYAL